MLDFVFRLFSTILLVLILQISVGEQTLEDYLMSFIQTSDSLAPVRDIAYSSVRRLNPNVQINSAEKRTPASSPSAPPASSTPSVSSGKGFLKNMKTDLIGDILKTVLSQYQGMMKSSLKSQHIIEGHHADLQKELDKITDVQKEQSSPPAPAKEKSSSQ